MALDPTQSPGYNFDLRNWKITLPVDSSGTNLGTAIEVRDLTSYSSRYFYTAPDGAMVFYAAADGATTSGSSYARSELREMNGTDRAAWTLSTGGSMVATLEVDAATYREGYGGRVVVGQIHGQNDELVRLYWENGKVYFANDQAGSSNSELKFYFTAADGSVPDVSLNEKFSYDIQAKDSTLKVDIYADGKMYSSTTTINSVWQSDTFYFKAGAYNGANESNGSGYSQTSFYDLRFSHTTDLSVALSSDPAPAPEPIPTDPVPSDPIVIPTVATLYISPTGSGTRDGSSWANAGSLKELGAFAAKIDDGGEILLRADQGTYTQTAAMVMQGGGVAGKAVTIRGADGAGNAMQAKIDGNGLFEAVRFAKGADHLKFSHMSFEDFSGNIFRFGDDVSGITIENVHSNGLARFIQDDVYGSALTATVSGLTVRDSSATGYRLGAVSLKYDSNNVLFENFVADGQNRTGEKYVFGFHLHGTAHDVVFRNVTSKNNYGHASSTEYWNGDGFATERGVYNVQFIDTVASGNTDGGYDLKSSNTTLVRAVADKNTHNYRVWSDSITLDQAISTDADYYGGTGRATHIWLADNAKALVKGGSFTEPDAEKFMFNLSAGSTLTLDGPAISKTSVTAMTTGTGTLVSGGTTTPTDPAPTPTDPVPTPTPTTGVTLTGTSSDNKLTGTTYDDIINGNGGSDFIWGKAGNDTLTGGSGKDYFTFDTAPNAATNVDTITDFLRGTDKIRFQDSVFTKLNDDGVLRSSWFQKGTRADDSNDYVVYDKVTGNLFYDSDGNGAVAQVLIGRIANKADLNYNDFLVI